MNAGYWKDRYKESNRALKFEKARVNQLTTELAKARDGADWICPECGEAAKSLAPTPGSAVQFRHFDGEPLCPVIGPDGYEPATPAVAGTTASRRETTR